MGKERLDKILANAGYGSRREVKQMVKAGRVCINGAPAAVSDVKCDPDVDCISVDGQAVTVREHYYVMFHKPQGLLSATEDRTCETVLDRLPAELRKRGLFPVGRLDKDAEGLLLLTDDGALAHRLLSPRHHVDKVYYVRVNGELKREDCEAFARGIVLGDGYRCMSAELKICTSGKESEALVRIQEGKFHQVKRMLASCGVKVIKLKRLSMGPLELDCDLPQGSWRYLTLEEENALKNTGI